MRLPVLLGCCLLASAHGEAFGDVVEPFLKSYCYSCHGPEKQKGDRQFDTLPAAIGDRNALADYQDILDQLNLSEMPPKEAKQPTDEQRKAVIAWLTDAIAEYRRQATSAGVRPVLRRLNAREYRNTLRDLLQLDMRMFDPTATFPQDQTADNLDNVGEALVTSGYLLARYLEAAEAAVDKALLVREKPAVRTWTFRENLRQQPEIDQVHGKTNGFQWLTLYEVVGADKHEGAYAPIHDFAEGVPVDGFYTIRFEAEALNRTNPYEPEFLGMDPSEPFRLGIVPGVHKVGQLHKPQPIEPLLAELELADGRMRYEVRVWLDQGYTPRFTFRNGMMDVRRLFTVLPKRYKQLFPPGLKQGIVAGRYATIKHGQLPQIRIHEVEIEGPHYTSWPTASQQAVLGEDAERILATGEIPDVGPLLRQFLTRAYRRPVSDEDVERIAGVIEVRRRAGRSSLEAYGDGLKAALCSPNFLYLEEGGESPSHGLASRLSYFLWSSMPDDVLRDLAATDRLQNPEVLAGQVERMLADRRSDAFVDGFLDSWLNLRDLGATPPDRGRFKAYYHYELGPAMREETRRFTRHLIDENLDITNFLDSDFTFVNKPLARLYGLDTPAEPGFQKVALSNGYRGGLLGQASVLTVTANGIDTSPVVRGVWVLESILGDPPSPPPPDVEPLDPDIRGARTIREQLQKHRDVATCYDCHRKIDPLGFALENFDPIGRWRGSYARDRLVDASGELPSGETFEDVRELKSILLEREHERFARALTEKLLAYAIGRELTVDDRPQVDSIAGSARCFRDMIVAVAQSAAFRSTSDATAP